MRDRLRAISGHPLRGEFADYAASDIGYVEGDDVVVALRTQGARVEAMLRRWTDAVVGGLRYAAEKWTPREIIGHLIDDERIFLYRAMCVSRSEPLPLPGFDEKLYAANAEHESRSVESLRDEYAATRGASLAFFNSLSEAQWMRTGTVNGYVASVRGLAFHIAGHELHHLRILDAKYMPLMRAASLSPRAST